MKLLSIIPARGGSKGLPGKNLKLLGGKPLIQWSIEAARHSIADDLIVSTDSEEIASVARALGAEVPFVRPAEAATDQAGLASVVNHALEWWIASGKGDPDAILLLQPTSPFRTGEHISAALNIFEQKKPAAVVGVCEPDHHPYFCKKLNDEGNLYDLFEEASSYYRRQDVPNFYAVNGALFLVAYSCYRQHGQFDPPGSIPLLMDRKSSLDIDSLEDFELAQFYLSKLA